MAERKSNKSESRIGQRRKNAKDKDRASYAARREEFVVHAAEAFRDLGFDATSLSEIARRAGADRASVYYYVSSKEELFQEVCSGMLESNLEAAEKILATDDPAPQKLEAIIVHHMTTHEQGFPQWSVLVQEMKRITSAETVWARDVVAKMRRYEAIVEEIVEEGIAAGTVREDVPPRLVVHAVFGMLNWIHRWFSPGGSYSAAQVARAFADITLTGVAIDRPARTRRRTTS